MGNQNAAINYFLADNEKEYREISKKNRLNKNLSSKSNTSKNIIRKEMQNTEEGIDMCLALQQLKEDAIREGRAEGKRLGWKEGRIQGRIQGQRQAVHSLNELNRKLLEEGRTEDLFRSLQDINYQKKMMKEYGIELAPLS